ncbi:MAG: hypothetical protein K1000chlam4_00428 [Chlamydiae bacterium]|nr:hypothetical protein [Chlamydiota bacterium]
MKEHLFIFTPGVWKGEGQITFSMAEDELIFATKWTLGPKEEDRILLSQTIEVDNVSDKMVNNFAITDMTATSFLIDLENNLIGKVQGKGIVDEKKIAWEFRNTPQQFEGFEVYELQPDGSYKVRAEFTAGEGLRTYVKGTIRPT